MIISIKNNWDLANDKHTKFLSDKIYNYLKKDKSRSVGKVKAREFIEEVYHLLILCSYQDIKESITIYTRYLNSLANNHQHKKQFLSAIKKLFNYKNFTTKKVGWDAYKLCKNSITRTCPYCNQAYAMTIHIDKGACRPPLDHYYCKDTYPHLALVLNNLIPCCSTCNSSLKGSADFYNIEHLNPLWDNENIVFSIAHEEGIDELLIKLKNNSDKALIHINHIVTCQKTDRSLETFLLQDRYDFLIPEAIEFTLAKANYNESIKTGIDHFTEEDEATIIRFDKNKYQNYLLGRMYHDLSVQIDGFSYPSLYHTGNP
ncbi:hypothetical protein [Pantoea ananatis]|uniref:hypothetical protein n=1 Tax=Pantoea ananas TaxID=553 RepID=UPI001C8AFCD7|nr:hypothetical protein [Pantoea ananatis]MCW0350683.1 hypothetical protein [Pantoea ananatis]QZE31403.1 hypothetical protein K4732_20830 [Pantoea ananatis]